MLFPAVSDHHSAEGRYLKDRKYRENMKQNKLQKG